MTLVTTSTALSMSPSVHTSATPPPQFEGVTPHVHEPPLLVFGLWLGLGFGLVAGGEIPGLGFVAESDGELSEEPSDCVVAFLSAQAIPAVKAPANPTAATVMAAVRPLMRRSSESRRSGSQVGWVTGSVNRLATAVARCGRHAPCGARFLAVSGQSSVDISRGGR